MIMRGKFRVSDTWSGAAKNGKGMRASATLNDAVDGGQVKVNFADGVIPPEFVIDGIVADLHIKPQITNFGVMFSFLGFAKPEK